MTVADPTPLEDLFAAFVANGDERALQELLRRSAPPLRRLARRLGAGADDADDLVQETIVAAIQVADRFDRTRPLLPWLKGIMTFRAAHLARDEVRRRRRHAADGDVEQLAAATPSAADAAEGREFAHDLDRALAALPPHYRTALAQHLLEERSPRDIAAGGSTPRATVRVHLHRGLRTLRELLRRWSAPVLAVLLLGRQGKAANAPTMAGVAVLWIVLAGSVWWLLRPPESPSAAPAASTAATNALAPTTTPTTAASSLDREPANVEPRRGTEPDTSLAVRVLAADGTPVAGVAVTATPHDGSDPVLHQRTAISDAQGMARWRTVPAGPLDVRADRGASLALAAARVADDVPTLVLAAAPTRRGRVVDAHGVPVAGARIWLSHRDAGPWRGDDIARSAADGTFVLPHVGDGAFVAARHEQHAGSELVPVPSASLTAAAGTASTSTAAAPPLAAGADTKEPELLLRLGPPGGRITVLVRDERGEPMRDALVLVGDAMDATPLQMADGAAPLRTPPWRLRTDDDGRATTGAVAPGPQPVFVRAPGCAPSLTTVRVVGGMPNPTTIVLQRGARVHGLVVDSEDRALAQATIVARSAAPGGDLDTVTADDGTFVFEALPPGELVLAARANGRLPATVCVDAGPDDAAPIVLRLARARALTGRIDGLPPPDAATSTNVRARIRASWPASALHPEPLQAMVDEAGTFAIDGAPPGRPSLVVQLRGEPLWRPLDAFVQWDEDRVHVRLPAHFAADAFVRGTLRRDDGTPIASARLFVHQDRRRWQEIGQSRADGSFQLGPLPAGDYALYAETTQPAAPTVRSPVFALGAGSTHTLDVTAAATGELQLALRRSDGGSLGGLAVTLVDAASGRRAAVLDGADARQRLVAGDYVLFVMSDRAVWLDGLPVHVDAGTVTTVPHVLPAARRCQLLPRGVPLPSADRERLFTLHDERGREVGQFTLPADAPLHLGAVLAAGSYELRHQDATGRPFRGSLVVAAGDEACSIAVPMATTP